MHFSTDPTARGDAVAEYVRIWYELHRETWWDRNSFSRNQELLRAGTADEFILSFLSEVRRVTAEAERQTRVT